MALVAIILGGYAIQGIIPDVILLRWAFSPGSGHPETLLTALFLHGSWAHAFMNAAFALAFATPVTRFLGLDLLGIGLLSLIYLLSGVAGNLGFAIFNLSATAPLIGASGAISGLAAASARIMAGRDGQLGRLQDPLVIGMGAGWLITNLFVAILGFAPGAGSNSVAWQAHLVGFVAGMFLIDPVVWLRQQRPLG